MPVHTVANVVPDRAGSGRLRLSRGDDNAGRTEDNPSTIEGQKQDGVARLDDAGPDDPGVHPGATGMEFGGKAGEIPV